MGVFLVNRKENGDINFSNPYVLHYEDKSHSRIIYSLSFSEDELFVATCSRDKRVKIHSLLEKKVVFTKLFENIPTAVCFAHITSAEGKYVIVLGYESG